MFFLFHIQFRCRTTAPDAHLVSVHSKKHNDYLLCIVEKFNPKNLRIWLGGFEFLKVKKRHKSKEKLLSWCYFLFFN